MDFIILIAVMVSWVHIYRLIKLYTFKMNHLLTYIYSVVRRQGSSFLTSVITVSKHLQMVNSEMLSPLTLLKRTESTKHN